jgi:mannose-6-phosphate isomerase-like protein (cupin superfamily)
MELNNLTPIHTEYSKAETLVFRDAITFRILLSGKDTGGQQAIFEDIVEPGIGPGRHIHHHQDETFFFLEGDFVAEVDGKMYEFQPGDVAFIPRGTVHAFKNVGNSPGRLRYIFSPAFTIEAMFREFYLAAKDGGLTFDKMAEISLNHGQEFVGPPL